MANTVAASKFKVYIHVETHSWQVHEHYDFESELVWRATKVSSELKDKQTLVHYMNGHALL